MASSHSGGSSFQREIRHTLATPTWTSDALAAFDSADISGILLLDSIAVVLQTGDARLTGVDAHTGTVRWRIGRHGQGPGEFAIPNALVAMPPSQFGVIDIGSRALVTFNLDGRYAGRVTGSLFDGRMDSMCPARDGGFFATRFPSGTTVRALPDGNVVSEQRNTWPDAVLDSVESLMQARFSKVHRVDDPCILITSRGNFFGTMNPTTLRLDSVRTYADSSRMPSLERRGGAFIVTDDVLTGISSAFADSLHYVLFGGRTSDSARVIDVYSAPGGQYRWSIRLPQTTYDIDVDGDRVLVLERHGDLARVALYDLRDRLSH